MNLLNKKIIYLLSAVVLITGTLNSCNDEDIMEKPKRDADVVYLEVSMTVAGETRSYTQDNGTSNDGGQPGSDKESTITSMTVYICEAKDNPKDDVFLISLSANGDDVKFEKKTVDSKTEYINTATLTITDPEMFANIVANKKLRLYIVGNAEKLSNFSAFHSVFTYSTPDDLGEYGSEGLNVPLISSDDNAILDFSNKDAESVSALFADATDNKLDLNKGVTDKLTGFGAISLERGVARIDYKDRQRNSEATTGSGLDSNGFPVAGHVYPLGASGLYLKVDAMQPVNVAAQEYVFRHTSAGTETEAGNRVDLFGFENGGEIGKYTWIADSDRGSKTFLNAPTKNGDSYSLPSDKWTTLGSAFNAEDYRAWRYLSENTPASVSDMMQGLSTGVAFRVVICDAKGEPLTNLDASSFTGVTFDTSVSSAPTIKYKSVTSQLENLGDGKGYALTYYHWIRHNNKSGSVEITDPMEFAVVRNNIYKLSVIKFDGLPRPYNPDGKDEEETDHTLDIILEVKVKAWDYYRLEMDV